MYLIIYSVLLLMSPQAFPPQACALFFLLPYAKQGGMEGEGWRKVNMSKYVLDLEPSCLPYQMIHWVEVSQDSGLPFVLRPAPTL